MQAERQAPRLVEITEETDPGADVLEETLDRIGEDARERSESYPEQTEVPEGGE